LAESSVSRSPPRHLPTEATLAHGDLRDTLLEVRPLDTMRIIVGILSLACAAFFLFHVVASFRPLTLPTIRQLGQEQTFFYVLRLGPLSLSGWQILAFEAVLALLAIGFIVLGVYAFTSRHRAV